MPFVLILQNDCGTCRKNLVDRNGASAIVGEQGQPAIMVLDQTGSQTSTIKCQAAFEALATQAFVCDRSTHSGKLLNSIHR